MQTHERQRTLGAGLADQCDADGFRHFVEIDENFFALLESGRVADKLAGEGVDACVVHGAV